MSDVRSLLHENCQSWLNFDDRGLPTTMEYIGDGVVVELKELPMASWLPATGNTLGQGSDQLNSRERLMLVYPVSCGPNYVLGRMHNHMESIFVPNSVKTELKKLGTVVEERTCTAFVKGTLPVICFSVLYSSGYILTYDKTPTLSDERTHHDVFVYHRDRPNSRVILFSAEEKKDCKFCNERNTFCECRPSTLSREISVQPQLPAVNTMDNALSAISSASKSRMDIAFWIALRDKFVTSRESRNLSIAVIPGPSVTGKVTNYIRVSYSYLVADQKIEHLKSNHIQNLLMMRSPLMLPPPSNTPSPCLSNGPEKVSNLLQGL